MQLLASINDSEQWQQVLSNCQLLQLDSVEEMGAHLKGQSNIESVCIKQALSLTQITELLVLPDVNIILSLDAPESTIGQLLKQGLCVADALESWQQQTSNILALQAKHRRQLQLVQTEGMLINPVGTPTWLTINVPEKHTQVSSLLSSDIHCLLAAQALRQQPDVDRCYQRLIACSLPLLDQPQFIFNIDEVQQEYTVNKDQLFHAQAELEQLLTINQTLTTQNTELEQSNQRQIAELATKHKESEFIISRSQQQLRELQTQLESNRQENIVTKQELTATAEEKTLIQNQLFYIQEELEKSMLSNEKLELQKMELEQQKGKLEQHHNSLIKELESKFQVAEKAHNDATQKLTKQLKESNEENELIIQQLFHVQENLESNFHQFETKYRHLQVQSQREQVKLENKLNNALAEEVLAKHELAAAQAKLSRVTDSTVWKTVAPVRKMTNKLSAKKRANEQCRKDAQLLIESGYFDQAWYLQCNPDVAKSGVNPAQHYLLHGASEGRDPSPLFDGNWYLSKYPDVADNNINPLLHFVKFGLQEGRTAAPKLLQHIKAADAETGHNKNVEVDE